jgi:hypothetical protein
VQHALGELSDITEEDMYNGAWVTHDRFLDSQLGGSPAGPQTFRGTRSNQRKKKKKKKKNKKKKKKK